MTVAKLPPGTCPNEQPDAFFGLFQCVDRGGRFLHRPTAMECVAPARDPEDRPPSTVVTDPSARCNHDHDCAAEEYCIRRYDKDFGDPYHLCTASCVTDADCGPGKICLCGQETHAAAGETITLGQCYDASCASDADCGDNAFCRTPQNDYWCYASAKLSFSCQVPEDECSSRGECFDAGGDDWHPVCTADPTTNHLVCDLVYDDC
jgi:hypothetical protein